jgi:hypothetical protein
VVSNARLSGTRLFENGRKTQSKENGEKNFSKRGFQETSDIDTHLFILFSKRMAMGILKRKKREGYILYEYITFL